jgi:hypothetical protein
MLTRCPRRRLRRGIQALHVGPYEREPETLAALDAEMRRRGLLMNGRHHEIYLTDVSGPPEHARPHPGPRRGRPLPRLVPGRGLAGPPRGPRRDRPRRRRAVADRLPRRGVPRRRRPAGPRPRRARVRRGGGAGDRAPPRPQRDGARPHPRRRAPRRAPPPAGHRRPPPRPRGRHRRRPGRAARRRRRGELSLHAPGDGRAAGRYEVVVTGGGQHAARRAGPTTHRRA